MNPKRIIVGVAGGIAAYKACSVVRQLGEAGHDVRVVPTESALRFVGSATFEALSGHPVHTGVFENVPDVPHVRLGQDADLVLVAPATADLLARAAAGRADDLLTATLLTARCPVLFAPAMHTEMWQHPATADNVATLRRRGAVVLEPASGRLTGADTGPGRLPEPEEIVTFAELLLARPDALPYDLHGSRFLITAGGTREALDPVRFIGNRSSGKQGYAVARVAAQRGADVTLIAGNTAGLADPAGVHVLRVDLRGPDARGRLQTRPRRQRPGDGRRGRRLPACPRCHQQDQEDRRGRRRRWNWSAPTTSWPARSVSAPTGSCRICAPSSGSPPKPVTQNGDVLFHARAKLARKACDLLVVNAVGDGRAFEVDSNDGWLLSADGTEAALEHGSKTLMASRIVDAIAAFLSGSNG